MSRGTVLCTDPIGGDASFIAGLLETHDIVTLTPAPDSAWQDHGARADGVIVNLTPIDAAAFAKLPRCRVIGRLGVGVNNIDLVAARARGVIVTNVPDYCREEVSEHALALILSLVRKVPVANADIQRHLWNQLRYRPIHRLSSLTLGLIGFGRLAQSLAKKASALGMRVLAHDPFMHQDPTGQALLVTFSVVLQAADVISLHAPLSPETRGLIGQTEFQQMKRGAILINTSRGELIDEAALMLALDEGRVSGAALDVMGAEPPPLESPLRGRPNLLLTPHMAFYSEESLIELQRTAAEDVARALCGQPPLHAVG